MNKLTPTQNVDVRAMVYNSVCPYCRANLAHGLMDDRRGLTTLSHDCAAVKFNRALGYNQAECVANIDKLHHETISLAESRFYKILKAEGMGRRAGRWSYLDGGCHLGELKVVFNTTEQNILNIGFQLPLVGNNMSGAFFDQLAKFAISLGRRCNHRGGDLFNTSAYILVRADSLIIWGLVRGKDGQDMHTKEQTIPMGDSIDGVPPWLRTSVNVVAMVRNVHQAGLYLHPQNLDRIFQSVLL